MAMTIFALVIVVVLIAFLARLYNRKINELSSELKLLQSELEKLKELSGTRTETPEHPPAAEIRVPEPPKPATPPPFPSEVPPIIENPAPPPRMESRTPAVNWERFMGVNLFAWIGGFVLFLAAAFFVKYSIDNNLISPQIRIALGVLLAIALLVIGLRLSLKQYRVSAQTLCSTGILILYVDVFASHIFYQFIGITFAFGLMILVTAAAFFLAVRLDAKVVAILGLLGGFLTPSLLSTGVDNPLGLFSYILILDAGLIAIALRKKWRFLILLAAVGTVLMQIGWAAEFFKVEKVDTALKIFATFEFLFLFGFFIARKMGQVDDWLSSSVLLIPFFTILFAFYLLGFTSLTTRPAMLFSFCLLAELALIGAVLLRPSLHAAHMIAGVLIFFLLAIWTGAFLNESLLNWGLGVSLAYALAHSFLPLMLKPGSRTSPPQSRATNWIHLFPALTMIVLLLPIFKLTEVSLSLWIIVFLVDAIAVCLAVMTGSILSLIGVLLLTLFAMGAWIVREPAASFELSEVLILISGFAVFFFGSGIFTGRKFIKEGSQKLPDELVPIPLLSTILPFLLLMLVIIRLSLKDPSPVFGIGLFLIILILGLWRWLSLDLLTLAALFCCLALEYTWYSVRFDPANSSVTLLWYLLFLAIFAVVPFLFHKDLLNRNIPWLAAALSGPLHFYLLYKVIDRSYQNPYMGLIPAALAVIPFVSLLQRRRALSTEESFRNSQLAAFGAATLFFVTLIFPVQFEREWITIGWALEGAALLWLFHRIPHPGLRWLGCFLLAVAFLRLTINPSVLSYYERSTIRIVNWYLYTYGIVTASLLMGGWFEGRIAGKNMRPLLYTLGTILAFVLVNIEIADFFSDEKHLKFQFSGNFARDMTYSIAWALFAFILLMIGIKKNLKPARYAAMSLIGVTLLKLFLHDLINLKQLYRVGALVAVAAVLIVASYLYQRFVSFESNGEVKTGGS
jgi:uncharacterized membrane protein